MMRALAWIKICVVVLQGGGEKKNAHNIQNIWKALRKLKKIRKM
jgi:hypothetical protein